MTTIGSSGQLAHRFCAFTLAIECAAHSTAKSAALRGSIGVLVTALAEWNIGQLQYFTHCCCSCTTRISRRISRAVLSMQPSLDAP